ncbi:hypothetical protein ABT300_37335 [Streptomyces sp. NPDC001027]|uniref:hypothetical protein n=1 Tax=Streptomyces sp. NPDC001027 TaxID=3154771 RepID=UPI0033168B79
MWWTAALDEGLPPGAPAGADDFAAALPDELWLPPARRSAAHTPTQADAERATHPPTHPPTSPPAASRPAQATSARRARPPYIGLRA